MRFLKIEQNKADGTYKNMAVDCTLHVGQHPYREGFADKAATYEVCPSCLKPVYLSGIARGCHVSSYEEYTRKSYEYCPFVIRNIVPVCDESEDEYLPLDEGMMKMYRLVRGQYDRIVWFIEKELDIRCSYAFWEKAMRSFVINEVYCYPFLTEANLPYMFAYFCVHLQSVYRQWLLRDSDICRAVSRYPGIRMESTKDGYERIGCNDSNYARLIFRFTDAEVPSRNGKLHQKLLFCVDEIVNGRSEPIFEKEIEVKQDFLHLADDSTESGRDKKLLEIAEKYLNEGNSLK